MKMVHYDIVNIGPYAMLKLYYLALNKLCFWTLSIVWCLKKKTKLRN